MPEVAERAVAELYRRFPPRERDWIFKEGEGRAETEYASEESISFGWYFPDYPDLFRGRDVLDLGCGFGGRPVKYLDYGATSIVGLEISSDKVEHGTDFARRQGVSDRASFVLGTGEDIPCQDGSFDLVTMFDTFEHVVTPSRVLDECWRVLRPGGHVAMVFPPFYDVTGGSHLIGYATRLGWLNLVLPNRLLWKAAERRLREQGIPYRDYLRDLPSDKLPNQNGLTIRGFDRLVESSRLEPEQIRYLGHLQYRRHGLNRPAKPPAATLPLYRAAQAATRVPLLQELVTTRICAVLRKP